MKAAPRRARERHKEQVVSERQSRALELLGEEVAELEYRPVARGKACRAVALRKKLAVERGRLWLFEPDRYSFSITNDRTAPASEVVSLANDRRGREDLTAQLQGGVKALAMPVADPVSDGAYLAMAGLARGPKAWAALLLLPGRGRWAAKRREEGRSLLRREFGTFRVALIGVPRQVVRTAGRVIDRLLAWGPWRGVFPRLVERQHGRRLRRTDR